MAAFMGWTGFSLSHKHGLKTGMEHLPTMIEQPWHAKSALALPLSSTNRSIVVNDPGPCMKQMLSHLNLTKPMLGNAREGCFYRSSDIDLN